MSSETKKIEQIALGLNEAQKRAVLNPLDSCTKIVAGAGTGKTKIISKRFVKLVMDLFEQGVENPQSRLLVITFTDKAANEMKERIVKELSENNITLPVCGPNDLWISTFHSFCMKILKKYSIEAGLSPSFKMADEQKLKEVYQNLVKHLKYGEIHLLKDACNILQSANISINELSIASLNSLNKISDLDNLFEDIYLVIKKIKSLGMNPQEFLEKSSKSILEYSDIVKSIPFKFDTKEAYVSFWSEHLKGYIDDYCNFDEKVFDSIAKEKIILDKFGKRKAIEYGMAQGFPENIEPAEELEIKLSRVICGIYALYQAELQKEDIADFDDLINKTIEIFKKNELLRTYYQKYFKHIIVDEFQDTNGAQLELIELLLNPEKPDITYVGDRKQSIYGFRYAQMENLEVLFENVQKRYSRKFEPVNLSINYRSTPEVLNAVNFVTENELNLENESLLANPNIDFPETSKDIKVTQIDGFENAYEQKFAEAKYIASAIKNLKERDNAKFKDFAVLVKSHSQADIIEKELKKHSIPSVKKVNTGFFKENVVKNVISAYRLINNINDEQAFYRLLNVFMSDSEIFSFKKKLDKMLAQKIEFEEIKKLNLVQKFLVLQGEGEFKDSYQKKLFETINIIRKNKSSFSLMQIFETIKKSLVLFNCSSDFENEKAKHSLRILETIIDDFSQNENYISVRALLDYLEKAADDRNFELPSLYEGDLDAVQILTIHASKGLEFKYVFVLSIASSSKMSDKSNIIFDLQYGNKPGFGIIISKFKGKPNPKAVLYKHIWQKPREINESLRLFYVAVSRAKNYLDVLSFEPYGSVKPVDYVVRLDEYLRC